MLNTTLPITFTMDRREDTDPQTKSFMFVLDRKEAARRRVAYAVASCKLRGELTTMGLTPEMAMLVWAETEENARYIITITEDKNRAGGFHILINRVDGGRDAQADR